MQERTEVQARECGSLGFWGLVAAEKVLSECLGPLERSGQKGWQVKKLYVGNLPFSATEEQLREFFTQAGCNPSAISLIRDRFTGQSRGFAFVEVANDEEAERAINSLNGQNLAGRNLVINEARPQTERGGGGGRGYGGGGGGGRGRGGDRGDRGDRGNRW